MANRSAAALRFAIDTGDVRVALRLVGALTFFWMMRDYDAEAREWATEVRAIAGDTAPEGLRDGYALCQFMALMPGRPAEEIAGGGSLQEALELMLPLTEGSSHPMLVMGRAMAALLGGDLEGTRRGLADLADHPDPWLRAAQRMISGQLELNNGQIDLAAEQLEAGLAAFSEIGDRTGLLITLSGLAEVAMARNDPVEAIRLIERAQGHAADGLAANFGEMLHVHLARAKARTGDLAGARGHLEHAVNVAGRIGEHDDEVTAYVELSDLARREGDLAAAGRALRRALDVLESGKAHPGMQSVAGTVYSALGCLAEQQGDLAAAQDWHARAMDALTKPALMPMTSGPTLGTAMEGIAALAAARGEAARAEGFEGTAALSAARGAAERAAELLGLAHTLRGYRNDFSLDVTRARSAAAAALSEAELAAAYERGRAQGRDEALAVVP